MRFYLVTSEDRSQYLVVLKLEKKERKKERKGKKGYMNLYILI